MNLRNMDVGVYPEIHEIALESFSNIKNLDGHGVLSAALKV